MGGGWLRRKGDDAFERSLIRNGMARYAAATRLLNVPGPSEWEGDGLERAEMALVLGELTKICLEYAKDQLRRGQRSAWDTLGQESRLRVQEALMTWIGDQYGFAWQEMVLAVREQRSGAWDELLGRLNPPSRGRR